MTTWLRTDPEGWRDRLAQQLARMVAAFGGKEFTDLTPEVYEEALEELSMEAIERAAKWLRRNHDSGYFPSTAEWYQVAERAEKQLRFEAAQRRPKLVQAGGAPLPTEAAPAEYREVFARMKQHLGL